MYNGVVVFIMENFATMFTKPSLERPARFTIIDALAATTRYLIHIRGRKGVWWASNSNKVSYLRAASGYNRHLVTDQPLDLI